MFKTANKYGQASFLRKPSHEDLIPQTKYVIETTITLEKEQFEKFIQDPQSDYDFIERNIPFMYEDTDGVWHCILVTALGYDYGILIESEGYKYARYAAYVKL